MIESDVLVIGAGMAGTATAAELADLGRKVVLLERESQPGLHATGRSAAVFSETYGGPAVRALTRASRDFYLAPPQGFAEYALVSPRPTMHIATADMLATLDALANSPDIGGVTCVLDMAEALRRCPILRPEHAVGVLCEPGSQDIDVHGLHQAYLRKLRGFGGTMSRRARWFAMVTSGVPKPQPRFSKRGSSSTQPAPG